MIVHAKRILVAVLWLVLVSCTPRELTPKSETISPTDSSTLLSLPTSSPKTTIALTIIPSTTLVQQNKPTSVIPTTITPSTHEDIPIEMQFSFIQMFDANTGWAVYSPPFIRPEISFILRTKNGVQIWENVTPPVAQNGSTIRASYFINANTALVISTRSHQPQSTTVDVFSWLTSNGGQTWVLGETLSPGLQDFDPYQIDFIDPQHGWMLSLSNFAMGNQSVSIFETQDGGLHWENKYDSGNHLSDTNTLWVGGYYPYSERLIFSSPAVGYYSDGTLFVSQDHGVSWGLLTLPPPNDLQDNECNTGNCDLLDMVSAPQFTSDEDGFLIRQYYLKSEATLSVYTHYPNATYRMPLPAAQYLYYTHDSGKTWTPKSSPVMIGTFFSKIPILVGC